MLLDQHAVDPEVAQTHGHQQSDRTPTHDQHRHAYWLGHGDPL
jgi:hypothetical protein